MEKIFESANGQMIDIFFGKHEMSIEDYYECESGEEIVLRFLSNSTGWRGEVARRIKAKLKTMCNIK